MALTEYVAVVSLTREITTRELLLVSAAIQKQVTRDFAPIWGLPATVDAFEDLEAVPSDYYRVVVFGEPGELATRLEFAIGEQNASLLLEAFDAERLTGVHLNAFTRQPFAVVALSEVWTVATSHEILELIADPYGNRLTAAKHPTRPDERVRYLLEVCDPCQSTWYPVNGVPVSDFYTPQYFEPVSIDGFRYSFTGRLQHPLDILEGGYLTWIDPRDMALYQLHGRDREPVLLRDLAEMARTMAPLRSVVDADPQTPRVTASSLNRATPRPITPGAFQAVAEASEGTARTTAQAIASLAGGLG
ncbi:MAG: hypothetical protein V7607_2158 [Solirubrobacteraceae bacterium]